MIITQAPTLPDPGSLKDLSPGVAYAFLGTAVILALLFYFGGAIRDRVSKKPPHVDTPAAIPIPPPALPQAIDQAEKMAAEYIAFLRGQLSDRERRVSDLERENARLENDVERLRWQRGT